LQPAGWGIAAILWTARTVAGWPGAVALVPAMPPAGIALVSLGGLWLCLWRRRWRYGGLAPRPPRLAFLLPRPRPGNPGSEDAKLVAVREADGSLRLSSGAADRFIGQEWLHRAGEDHRAPWPPDGSTGSRLTCEGGDCRYRRDGREVAILRGAAGLTAACA